MHSNTHWYTISLMTQTFFTLTKKIKNIRKIMNGELKLLFEWLCANILSLNIDKTEFIIFRPSKKENEKIVLKLNGSVIPESNKIKYVGIIFDPKLSWKVHISELCKKLSRRVGMLFKMCDICPETVLKSLYYGLFNSHLSYGIAIWGVASRTLLEKVLLLQKKQYEQFQDQNFLRIQTHFS